MFGHFAWSIGRKHWRTHPPPNRSVLCPTSLFTGVCRIHASIFGPFAPEIDFAIGLLVELGFVKEGEVRFSSDERVRYDYSLTDDGSRLAQSLIDANMDISVEIQGAIERIYQSGSLNYNQLSLAAKIAHIAESESRPMTAGDISSRAAELDWHVNPEVVLPVAGFLQSLDLIDIKSNDSQGLA